MDVGLNGNVELAIVCRMIALIRTHYTEHFNWKSHRLGRLIVRSAHIEDNGEWEAFLTKKFFSNADEATK